MNVSTQDSNIETAETRSETRLVMNGTGPRAEVVNEPSFSDLAESNEADLLDLDFSSLFHAWTRSCIRI